MHDKCFVVIAKSQCLMIEESIQDLLTVLLKNELASFKRLSCKMPIFLKAAEVLGINKIRLDKGLTSHGGRMEANIWNGCVDSPFA